MSDTALLTQLEKRPDLSRPHVAICIATCRRPEGLRRLLQALETLEFRAVHPASLRVIVVDNDPGAGAGLQVCGEFPAFRWDLKAVAEPRRGISFARNRVVQEALSLGADVIVFIDDDEVPEPAWLDVLLQVRESTGAEVVSGPVLPWFEEATPSWVVKGGFFDRARLPTGTEIDVAASGNLLIVATTLKAQAFDDRFGRSGGSDTMLTGQLRQQGAKIVWADEAIVRESVPRERVSARYILRREFARGNNWARVERELHPGPLVFVKRAVIALGRIMLGVLAVPSILLGRHAVIKRAAKASMGIGMLAGLFQFRGQLYK